MRYLRALQKWVKLIKKSVADENTQTPAMKIIATTQSLRDLITLLKRSKFFFPNSKKNQLEMYFGMGYLFNH